MRTLIYTTRKNRIQLLSTLSDYDAFLDHPIDQIFEELDLIYPNSKFILTLRDKQSWLLSRKRHVLRNKKNPRYDGNWLTINISQWEKLYDTHHRRVYNYFLDRPNDLLEINIVNGEGWEKLCPFLDLKKPGIEFPKKNTRYVARKEVFMNSIRTVWCKLKNNNKSL